MSWDISVFRIANGELHKRTKMKKSTLRRNCAFVVSENIIVDKAYIYSLFFPRLSPRPRPRRPDEVDEAYATF